MPRRPISEFSVERGRSSYAGSKKRKDICRLFCYIVCAISVAWISRERRSDDWSCHRSSTVRSQERLCRCGCWLGMSGYRDRRDRASREIEQLPGDERRGGTTSTFTRIIFFFFTALFFSFPFLFSFHIGRRGDQFPYFRNEKGRVARETIYFARNFTMTAESFRLLLYTLDWLANPTFFFAIIPLIDDLGSLSFSFFFFFTESYNRMILLLQRWDQSYRRATISSPVCFPILINHFRKHVFSVVSFILSCFLFFPPLLL